MACWEAWQAALKAQPTAEPVAWISWDFTVGEYDVRLGDNMPQTNGLEVPLYAATQPTAEPVAYTVKSKRDGSIMNEVAPTAWYSFDREMQKLREHAWVKSGAAEIVPLYLGPQPTAEAVLDAIKFGEWYEECERLRAEVEALRSMLREVADDICVKHCLGPEHIARIDAALRGKEAT
jgi:hypothetical protein